MGQSEATSGKQEKSVRGLSDRAKKIMLASIGGLAVIVGAVWFYFALTTASPPDLQNSTPEQVAQFLSNEQGFARMPIPRREQFLQECFQRFKTEEERMQLVRLFRQMSPAELQVVLDATYEIVHAMVMDNAQRYSNATSSKDRQALVDSLISRFKAMQGELSGQGNSHMNVGEPFKQFMPTNSDELSKMLVTRTTPAERAKAQPLIDAVARRYKEMRTQSQPAPL